MGKIIGIDLGTTNCCVAVSENGGITVLTSRTGQRTMPSIVAFLDSGEVAVGATAQRQAVTNPQRTIVGVKRLIGRKLDDPEVRAWKKFMAYELKAASNGDAWIATRDGEYSPQQVSASLLAELKSVAEEYLGEEVTDAVVTVPAYFNDGQRQATKDAGTIAGLRIRNILNEPTAAALGYGIDKKKDQTLAIFDLGGGTFDITIMRVTGDVFEVLATNGDTSLGGDDFDRALMAHVMLNFARDHGVDLQSDPVALQRIKESCEAAKKELSSVRATSMNLPFITVGPKGPLHLREDTIDRALLGRLTAGLLERLKAPCDRALKDAGVRSGELDQVLLVGGMTRMPAVQETVEEIFGKAAAKNVNVDEIVAVGAATQCAMLSGEIQDVVLLDVTPHSLGVRVKDGRMSFVIPKNSTIPTSEKKHFATTRNDQTFVEILVFQGEEQLVDHNTYLGSVTLEDLPPKAAALISIEVTFLIDADGVLQVSAREVSTGKQTSVKIKPRGGLSQSEVDRLAKVERKRAR